jgi:hypothetical protein
LGGKDNEMEVAGSKSNLKEENGTNGRKGK